MVHEARKYEASPAFGTILSHFRSLNMNDSRMEWFISVPHLHPITAHVRIMRVRKFGQKRGEKNHEAAVKCGEVIEQLD